MDEFLEIPVILGVFEAQRVAFPKKLVRCERLLHCFSVAKIKVQVTKKCR